MNVLEIIWLEETRRQKERQRERESGGEIVSAYVVDNNDEIKQQTNSLNRSFF